jgi:hypothetical protein
MAGFGSWSCENALGTIGQCSAPVSCVLVAGPTSSPAFVRTRAILRPPQALLLSARIPRTLASTAAAVNELSAARRRPALTENQVRAMIGGGAKKPVERAFGAVGDSRTKTACCFSTMEMSWYYFCKV